jgi:hypothetical protein
MAFGLPFFTHGHGEHKVLMVQLLTKKPPEKNWKEIKE